MYKNVWKNIKNKQQIAVDVGKTKNALKTRKKPKNEKIRKSAKNRTF